MNKNIAIIMGGYSSEYYISIKSGEVVYDTLKDEDDLNLYKIIIEKDNWHYLDDNNQKHQVSKDKFEVILENHLIKFDLVFNTIHGIPGENGEIQRYFENLGIFQTSSNSKESSLTFDKNRCKEKIKSFGYLTPHSILTNKTEVTDYKKIISQLNFPVFVKPNSGGSSFGISRVEEKKDLDKALDHCFKEDSYALIEEEIVGREITVGVINYRGKVVALPPTEIKSYNRFFDYNAKYMGESDEITPAEISPGNEKEVMKIATEIYNKLNLKGFSRCDFIMRDNMFYFLEVNTNPGLTKESILPQQALAAHISLKDLFRSVID